MESSSESVIDLTSPEASWTPGLPISRVREIVRGGDVEAISGIPGLFAVVEREGKTVRLARTLGAPLRYFVAKRFSGPFLVVAERIRQIWDYCRETGIEWQFDPFYARMVPAHYLVEIDQVGCPDPNPRYHRFFTPEQETAAPAIEALARRYIEAVYDGLRRWLADLPAEERIALAFSGGVDSTSVLCLARHALGDLGEDPDRIVPFTLEIDGGGPDGDQAREVLGDLGLDGSGEFLRVGPDALDLHEAIDTTEDYRPLDLQCAAAMIALLRAVRERHPDLTYLLDGDGSDENLRSYPLEDSDLTIRSVLKNPLLYVEGWGVDAIKHSLTYSGGLSRSHVRTWAPARRFGFTSFSPYTLREAIREAAAIPLTRIVGEDPSRLYSLKAKVIRAGVKAVTGIDIGARSKRRFQEGLTPDDRLAPLLGCTKEECRSIFRDVWERRMTQAASTRAPTRV